MPIKQEDGTVEWDYVTNDENEEFLELEAVADKKGAYVDSPWPNYVIAKDSEENIYNITTD